MGFRTNAIKMDFSDILPEEVEADLKRAAEISMGTEIADLDLVNISHLCEEIVEMSDYRSVYIFSLNSRNSPDLAFHSFILGSALHIVTPSWLSRLLATFHFDLEEYVVSRIAFGQQPQGLRDRCPFLSHMGELIAPSFEE